MDPSTKVATLTMYTNNSACVNGKDYCEGHPVVLRLMNRYGIEQVRDHDSRHREQDGAVIKLFATRPKKYHNGRGSHKL